MTHGLTEEEIREYEDDEGYRSAVYLDSLGYSTIGIGRLVDRRKGGGISRDEAIFLLSNDLKKVDADLDRALPWWRQMNPPRQRVLRNMCFNMGLATLLTFKNTLAAMKAGDYRKAAAGMLASKWATQVKGRAQRLAKTMETGIYETTTC